MAARLTIGPRKVVRFSYTLQDDDGTLLDEARPDDPAVYLHGAENIIDGLEAALLGRSGAVGAYRCRAAQFAGGRWRPRRGPAAGGRR